MNFSSGQTKSHQLITQKNTLQKSRHKTRLRISHGSQRWYATARQMSSGEASSKGSELVWPQSGHRHQQEPCSVIGV